MIRKQNPRTSRFKEALYRTAIRFEDFSEFSNYYWKGLALGTYWIGTNSEDFDFRPLEREYAKEGKIIGYVSPEYLDTEYAIEVDTSRLNPKIDIKENKTESTNSIKLFRPDLITLHNTYDVPKAVEVFKYNTRYFPITESELKKFWEYSIARHEQESEGKRQKTRRRKK